MTLYRLPLAHETRASSGFAPKCTPQAPYPRHWPLHGAAASRALEEAAQSSLPRHTLMQRAALALARWVRALYPHVRHIWVLAGPGNNGGDGLLAAALWQEWARSEGLLDMKVTVTWTGTEERLPPDAAYALGMARQAGVPFTAEAPEQFDVAVDALLGLGARTVIPPAIAPWLDILQRTDKPVLQVDLPSGLSPDTGNWFGQWRLAPAAVGSGPRHTLSLLTLKPGLFTGLGRDLAGDVWWDDLDVAWSDIHPPTAWLRAQSAGETTQGGRPHASHKGSRGDVLVLGGQGLGVDTAQPSRLGQSVQAGPASAAAQPTGQAFNTEPGPGGAMVGAALLAARAALHGGAGRVFVGLFDNGALNLDSQQPELMFRSVAQWMTEPAAAFGCSGSVVVCGCGGGAAVEEVLPAVLAHSTVLVLDADALNAIARQTHLQESLAARGTVQPGQLPIRLTVLTPHPLEAARLLGTTTGRVQADRLSAAQELAERFQACVVLKGSGSVVVAPGERPVLNATGNARLATGGTGDVLAGLIGARLAELSVAFGERSNHADLAQEWKEAAFRATSDAVAEHGIRADQWPDGQILTASALAASQVRR